MNARDLPEIPAAPPTAAVRAAEYAARQAKGVDATTSHKTHRAWIMAKALTLLPADHPLLQNTTLTVSHGKNGDTHA